MKPIEQPPKPSSDMERFEDTPEMLQETAAEKPADMRREKELSPEDKQKIKEIEDEFRVTPAIEKELAKRDTGTEPWSDERTPEEKEKQKHPWYSRIAAMLGFAGAIASTAIPKEAAAKEMKDSTDKKPAAIEAVRATSRDSLRNTGEQREIQEVVERKKLGAITLEGRLVVPHHDPSIEVSIAYFSGNESDEHKVGTMIAEMKKLGYDVAPAHVLDDIVRENPALSKKAPWLMTLEQESDLDDTRAMEKTVTVTEEDGRETIAVSSPELAVYPTYNPTGKRGRFEANKGLTYGEEGYGYVFVKKTTTASYASGVAAQ